MSLDSEIACPWTWSFVRTRIWKFEYKLYVSKYENFIVCESALKLVGDNLKLAKWWLSAPLRCLVTVHDRCLDRRLYNFKSAVSSQNNSGQKCSWMTRSDEVRRSGTSSTPTMILPHEWNLENGQVHWRNFFSTEATSHLRRFFRWCDAWAIFF